jgi:hypothetical protein
VYAEDVQKTAHAFSFDSERQQTARELEYGLLRNQYETQSSAKAAARARCANLMKGQACELDWDTREGSNNRH